MKLFEFSDDAFNGLLIPWILYPFIEGYGKLLAVVVIVFIGISLVILATRNVTFYDDKIIIRKYRAMFTRLYEISYSEVDYVKTAEVTMSLKNSTVTLFYNQKKNKVNVFISRYQISKFVDFIKSKNIKLVQV